MHPESNPTRSHLLHVVIKQGTNEFGKRNGLIYDPISLFNPPTHTAKLYDPFKPYRRAQETYTEFFTAGSSHTLIPVATEMSVPQLAEQFEVRFGIGTWAYAGLHHLITSLISTDEEAKTLLEDLAKNPLSYLSCAPSSPLLRIITSH